jgi:hypothetical protein
MNKSYKSVWNETTGTYVAASETAKSRGKSSRSQKALVAALLAAGVGFGTAVKSEAAATPNSYAAGVLGTDSSNSDCISSADGAQVSTGADCTSGSAAQEAGIVSYDANGNAGAYFTVTDPNTAHVGAGGVDQLLVTNNGLFVLNALDMGSNKITNLAAGTAATDAANFGQVTATAQSIAAALGGGASVDASGRVTTPTYTIGGLSYSDVGSALGGLDARMTSDETAIDNLAVSGSKYIAVGTGGTARARRAPGRWQLARMARHRAITDRHLVRIHTSAAKTPLAWAITPRLAQPNRPPSVTPLMLEAAPLVPPRWVGTPLQLLRVASR